jgi:hypothetical protein
LPELVEELVKEHRGQDTAEQATLVAPTRNLYISQTNASISDSGLYDLVIDCNARPEASEGDPKRFNLGCRSSKLGSRDLRQELDKVRAFVSSQLATDPSRSLLVTCETGKDLSAGALLAIICLFYNDDGMPLFRTPTCLPYLPSPPRFSFLVLFLFLTVLRVVHNIPSEAINRQTIHTTTSCLDRVIKT